MKKAWTGLLGFLAGVAVAGVAGWMAMPSLMLREYPSPLGLEETVERIEQNAVAQGWVVSSVMPINDSIKKHGGGDLPPVRLINICEPHHAFRILSEDSNKVLSVMMPCTISVYERADGTTRVGVMNAGLLGKLFGGTVAEVMGGTVAQQQEQFISFLRE